MSKQVLAMLAATAALTAAMSSATFAQGDYQVPRLGMAAPICRGCGKMPQ